MKKAILRFTALGLAVILLIFTAACAPSSENLEGKMGVSFDNIICQYYYGPVRIEQPSDNYITGITVYADGKARVWAEHWPINSDDSIILAETFTTLSDRQTGELISAIRRNRLLALDNCTNHSILDGEWSRFHFFDAEGNKVHSCGGSNCTNLRYCTVEDLLFKTLTRSGINIHAFDDECRDILFAMLVPEDPDVSLPEASDDCFLEGRIFNIYCFNEQFKDFLDKYYLVPHGITVNWIINQRDQEIYYEKLDAELEEMSTGQVADDDLIDMFLVDTEHLSKYVNNEQVVSLSRLGYEIPDTWYPFAVEASTASDGEHKAVPVYLCPGVLVYRRSIAKAVLGTDDPEQVQSRLDTWEKFEETAELAAEKGYYMTASPGETMVPLSGNPHAIATVNGSRPAYYFSNLEWTAQAKRFSENGYTLDHGFWSEEKQEQMGPDGKTMCFFGPSWYYHFFMDPIHDATLGDWAICKGPQTYNWGDLWLLGCADSDNYAMISDVFYEFSINSKTCQSLIEYENVFPNNTDVVEQYAKRFDVGLELLGGQNDYAVMHEIAMECEWNGMDEYDFYTVDHLPDYILPCLKGEKSFDEAAEEFLADMNEYFSTPN